MPHRGIARVNLRVRLPVEGHAALVTYAKRKGLSLNSAIWVLLQRGLEVEERGAAAPRPGPRTRQVP